jgi:hypothetical protein
MKQAEIEAIKARLAAATPGPWAFTSKGNTVKSYAVASICGNVCSGISPKTGNALFISEGPADVADLMGYVAQLEAQVSGLRQELGEQEVAKLALVQENEALSLRVIRLTSQRRTFRAGLFGELKEAYDQGDWLRIHLVLQSLALTA